MGRNNSRDINGIYYNKRTTKAEEVASVLHHKEVNIMGFAETNTDWNQKNITEAVRRAFTDKFKQTYIATSTSTMSLYNLQQQLRSYKPGGTATIVTGNTTSRVETPTINDPLGNFSAVILRS